MEVPMLEKRLTLTPQSDSLLAFALSRRIFCALPGMAFLPATLAEAGQVASNDPRIHVEKVAIEAEWGKLDCYFVRPTANPSTRPGVIVAHDKLGPTPHFEDVARRLALTGFATLLPDYASRFGGTPNEPGPALEVVGMTKLPDMIADTQSALLWLQAADGGNGNIGAVGFGLGGTAINNAVTKLSDLKAAVTYYGHPPPAAEVEKIRVPVLFNFAGKDQFIDPEIPGFVDALKKAHVKYELFKYDNTIRGFEDDSAPAHYSAEAATLAWSRTDAFLKTMLK